MKIGALSPWYGSKRTLATRIIKELGAHRVYWEPFCGSWFAYGEPSWVRRKPDGGLQVESETKALEILDGEGKP